MQKGGKAGRAGSVSVERRVVDRELQPERRRVTCQRREHVAELLEREAARLGGIDGGKDGWVQDIGVDVNPEAVDVRQKPLECGGGRSLRPPAPDRVMGEVEHGRRTTRVLTIPRLIPVVAASDDDDVPSLDERRVAAEAGERRVTASNRERETHAGRGTGA